MHNSSCKSTGLDLLNEILWHRFGNGISMSGSGLLIPLLPADSRIFKLKLERRGRVDNVEDQVVTTFRSPLNLASV
jgi:hypothetical protein